MLVSPRVLALASLLAGLFVSSAGADDVDRLPSHWARWYGFVVPGKSETRWNQIPWVTDLTAGIEQAKKEKRPLCLWVAGDEPLDRC